MTTDLPERVRRLKATRKCPTDAKLTVLAAGLTYETALREEASLRTECGFHCEGADGDRRVAGHIWTLYRLDW